MGHEKRRRRKKKGGCLVTVIYMLIWLFLLLCAFLYCLKRDEIHQAVQRKMAPEVPYQKVELKPDLLSQKFYYGKLEEEEKTAYQEILQGVTDQEEEIYLHLADAERANELLEYVLKDEPGLFWCDGTAKATCYEGADSYTVLEPEYRFTPREREKMQAEIETGAGRCLEGIDASASDYDKILYVFEYIVNTVDYDASAGNNQNIYSVFVTKRSVCAGYSRAAQYLLEKLGVFCTYVTGTTVDGQAHAWNLVMCDGEYYYLDTTWGDPVFLSQEIAMDMDYISYDYMCCDDKELLRTHIPDRDVTLPECSSMDANYYVVNQMYYENYDAQTALEAMNETISNGDNPTVFKFSNPDSYQKAKEDLFDKTVNQAAQNLASLYDLPEVRYNYFDEKDLNKIVIYWQYD